MSWRKKIDHLVNPEEHTRASRAYDFIMLLAIAASIIPLMFRFQSTLFWLMEIVATVCFIIDYIFRWSTADYHSDRSRLGAFLVYPFTPMAIIDLLSILPIFNIANPAFRVTRVYRLMRILRIFRVIRYFEPLKIIFSVIRRQRRILWTVLVLSVFYIFITALIMFNAEEDINPETGKYLFENFFDAFYWAACTLTTVGYGDLYPISHVGRVISIISSMVGIAIIALPSGIITAGYMDELNRRNEKKKDIKS
jgi:voltage-gated potassium channel